ncbi:methionine biosynthesis protein MetW [Alphaproteobacteria bacterium]|jgi:methionine biosynthesis protein MetW|nr:methionine biosynthesis protein MetW [Alphaproteobacteria bacterium]
MKYQPEIRGDLELIAGMVGANCRVLDVGCGDGTLLGYLKSERQVDGRGIELSMDGVRECVSNGLSVVQGDADTDLDAYPDNAFDYVVLSQTLQATRQPRQVVESLVRIGKRAILSFPNFGHFSVRWKLLFGGRMPVTGNLPDRWYDTPNIHLCTITDFIVLCDELDAKLEQAIALDRQGNPLSYSARAGRANFLAPQALFVLQKH